MQTRDYAASCMLAGYRCGELPRRGCPTEKRGGRHHGTQAATSEGYQCAEHGDFRIEQAQCNHRSGHRSINKVLKDSGFQGFNLRAKEDDENVYEVIREDGSVAKNLSEGERNFIAFLYFYHQVRGSMNGEELKEEIVMIDDSVSSMDSTALFLVSAIVREMINVCRNNTEYLNPKAPGDYIKQLFVLTHNVYFHREITYKQAGYYNCTSFYMIQPFHHQALQASE